MLDLHPQALAGHIGAGPGLRHHPIESSALKAFEPLCCRRAATRVRSQKDRRLGALEQGLELFSPLAEWLRAQVRVALREDVERHVHAGVASLSIRTRESAGWMRCWRAPKSRPFSPTTISSPSSTTFSGRSLRNAGKTSGKYRVIGRAPRLTSSTLSPSRKTSVRKPSHFGSYSQLSPWGMPSPGADSIGSISSGIGSFKEGIYPQFVYILWMKERCATISPVGKAGSLIRLHAPTPALGSSRKRASRFMTRTSKAARPRSSC